MHGRQANTGVHFRRPHEDKVVAHGSEATPGARAQGDSLDDDDAGPLGARAAYQKHHEAGYHQLDPQLP